MKFKKGDYVQVADCSGLDSRKVGQVVRTAREGDGIPGISIKTIQGEQIEMFGSRLIPIPQWQFIAYKLTMQ